MESHPSSQIISMHALEVCKVHGLVPKPVRESDCELDQKHHRVTSTIKVFPSTKRERESRYLVHWCHFHLSKVGVAQFKLSEGRP